MADTLRSMVASASGIGDRIRTLMDERAMEQQELASTIGIDASALSRALRGQRAFKALEIALIAEAFGVTTNLILEEEPGSDLVRMAARLTAGQRNVGVAQAVDRAHLLVRIHEMLPPAKTSPVRFPEAEQAAPMWSDGEAMAAAVLESHFPGRTEHPPRLAELAAQIERRLGFDVALEPFPAGVDGLSLVGDQLALAIVNTARPAARQRWTLAHELGHLVFRDTEDLVIDEQVFSVDSPVESRANAFAAGFLMPRAWVESDWLTGDQDEAHIALLLSRYGVSLDALAYRLHNIGRVDADGRDAVREARPLLNMFRGQVVDQSDGRWVPGNLTTRALDAWSTGHLGIRPLASLANMSPDDLLDRLDPDADEVRAMESKFLDA